MGTRQSAVTPYGWGVKVGVTHSTVDETCGWHVAGNTVLSLDLTRAIPVRPRDEC